VVSEEGGFSVLLPALPGLHHREKCPRRTIKNIREAIELYLEPVEDDLVLQSEVAHLQ